MKKYGVKVYIADADVSDDVSKYLMSMTYTDNSEDECDDLQLKLTDCTEIWKKKWLNSIADSLKTSWDPFNDRKFRVNAASGLIVRKSPRDTSERLGNVSFGTVVTVYEFSGGWAEIDYGKGRGYIRMHLLKKVKGESRLTASSASSASFSVGDTVTVSGYPHVSSYAGSAAGYEVKGYTGKITYLNLNGSAAYPVCVGALGWFSLSCIEGEREEVTYNINPRVQAAIVAENGEVLNCGQFELDSLDLSGPPATVTIKGTALPFDSSVRNTPKSRSWESFTLKGIGEELCEKNGMGFMYLPKTVPRYERVEQYRTSDIDFLKSLCKNAGFTLKVADNIIIIFDGKALEKSEPVTVITKETGFEKYKLKTGQTERYTSCRVSYVQPNGRLIEGYAYIDKFDKKNERNRQLEINSKVKDATEAHILAEQLLRFNNRFEYTAEFTFPGNVSLVAGQSVRLSGWGKWDGVYLIKTARHTVGTSGYTTQISLSEA